MRLSELLEKLTQVAALAKVQGNNDPDISFWHDQVEIIEHLELAFPDDLDDAMLITRDNTGGQKGDFSFRVVITE